ncbi:MAG: DinB family protein [Candidatus Thorarchaeota archaeon]
MQRKDKPEVFIVYTFPFGGISLTFKQLAEYHIWTGKKMREVVEHLREKEFTKKVLGQQSVRSICEHMVMALATCFNIADDKWDESIYKWISQSSKLELISKWNELDSRLAEVIREIPQGTIEVPHISDKPFEIQAMDFFMQYILHTTHHRGQLASALRILGKDVPGTDYLMFFRERAAVS